MPYHEKNTHDMINFIFGVKQTNLLGEQKIQLEYEIFRILFRELIEESPFFPWGPITYNGIPIKFSIEFILWFGNY